MSDKQLKALCNGLIALCQRYDLLPTNEDALVSELQIIASDECPIAEDDLLDFIMS